MIERDGYLQFEQLREFPQLYHAITLKGTRFAPPSPLVELKQVHGKEVVAIDRKNYGKALRGDALTTSEKGIYLSIKHADCQAGILYDPVNHALGTVHCGWKGSVQNIYKNTIEKMAEKYGTKPENLLLCIGPSLGPDSAEFIHYERELPMRFRKFQIRPTYFDFWAISKMQAEACGILPGHIEIAGIDTYTDPDRFHSYRRDKGFAGRHRTIAGLL